MKETNEKTTKQLDEKELEQVSGGNQTNPAAPDTQGDGEKKITRSAVKKTKTCATSDGDKGQKITEDEWGIPFTWNINIK